ncbi:antibiotic biosynthesis monooxygenase [Aciduricibacillus chroicocephali]|uniref:Antibiotic biosynthesis monooxygenase n=1 Tax=Aciduricibacillus chroicocephali TaxID=3054939 RepID=A0ABY9KYS0_9BACI|nr:antibiotic biosynthesis monooxygenase [Bacillaceae bacterium 44XB]
MKYFAIIDGELESGLHITGVEGEVLTLQELNEKADIQGKEYETIDASGDLKAEGTIVLNNIPISLEGRNAFEERFLGRARAIEETPGFIAIRVLRPLNDEVYVVLTQWESEQAFRDWQSSSAYSKAHKRRHTAEGLDQRPGVLSKKPFHKLYTV